ncbi:hypothetical protein JXO59_05380 [candidate division KSB1 bacterium]|nr:hypothetical protein [candidate division KSB1 bacterium]
MASEAIIINRGRDRTSLNAWYPLSSKIEAGDLLQINRTSPIRFGASLDGKRGFLGIDFSAVSPQAVMDAGRKKLAWCLKSASSGRIFKTAKNRDGDQQADRVTIGTRTMTRTRNGEGWTTWTFPLTKCRVEHAQIPVIQLAVSHYACFLNTRLYFGSLFYSEPCGWGFSMSLPDETDAALRERMLLRFDQLGQTFIQLLWPNILALYEERLAREFNDRNGLTG